MLWCPDIPMFTLCSVEIWSAPPLGRDFRTGIPGIKGRSWINSASCTMCMFYRRSTCVRKKRRNVISERVHIRWSGVYIRAAPFRSITLTSIIQRKNAAPRGYTQRGCRRCINRRTCVAKARNNERAANKIVSAGSLRAVKNWQRWLQLRHTLKIIVQRHVILSWLRRLYFHSPSTLHSTPVSDVI